MFEIVRKPFKKLTGDAKRGVAGLGWMGVSQFAGLIIRLGSNLLLTRLLAPEAFGLLGTALAFMTTLEWLSDMGVQPALIRHPKGDQHDYLSTGWWIALFRGLGLTIVAALCAGPAADFYRTPELALVMAVLALRPFIFALRSPGVPMLRRELNYRSIFVDEFAMTFGGTAVSISLAFVFPSVWAIVGGTIFGAVVGVVVSYFLCPMWPGRRSAEASKEIVGFGRRILINTLLMALWLNLDRLLGLRLVSAAEMGLYTIAWNLAMVAEGLITRACDVHFSMLSRLDEDKQLASHRQIVDRVTKWVMPVFAIAACGAPFVIQVLYDARYQGAGILLSLLVCRLMVRGLGQLQFQFLMAQAQVGIASWAYLVALIVQGLLIVPLSARFGVNGLALSAVVSTTVLTATQAALADSRLRTRLAPVSVTLAWTTMGLFGLAFVSSWPV